MTRVLRAEYPNDQWLLDYNPRGHRWETYRQPLDWPAGLYDWLWETFGHPGTDPDTGVYGGWDYHGGWIYFYREDYVTVFKLKWS